MKGNLIFLSVILISFCSNARTSSQTDKKMFLQIVSDIERKFERILPFFINSQFSFIKTPRLEFPVIPSNLPDPLPLPNFANRFRQNSNNNSVLVGEISVCNSSILGISDLTDKMELSLSLLNVKYGVKTSSLSFEGVHDENCNIYNGDYVTTSSGGIRIEIMNLFGGFQFRLVIDTANNKLNIDSLVFDFEFEWLKIHMDGIIVNGKPHKWQDLTNHLKPTFDAKWKVAKLTVEKNIQNIVNEILDGCRLTDLIFQNYECLITVELIHKHLKLEVSKLFEKVTNGVCPAVVPDPTTTTLSPSSLSTTSKPSSKKPTGNKATITGINNLIQIISLIFVIFISTTDLTILI